MDKGLDIDTRRTLLAYHAALNGDFRAWFTAGSDPPATATLLGILQRLRSSTVAPRWDAADRALRWNEVAGHHLLWLSDTNYPALLYGLAHPPVLLYVNGDPAALSRAQIAIVGSRRATPAGAAFAGQLAADLAAHRIVTTSGLAYGIDAAAHRGALSAGVTVAVLGCGIDRQYPVRHQSLAKAIAGQGALVSEFPPGYPPLQHNFPRRNRLISGLSLGTVVVEAAERSGSISTALHALEQGREVFAVPGSVNNPLARGCHALLRQGAKLTTCVADVLEEFPSLRVAGVASGSGGEQPTLGPREQRLLGLCGSDPVSVDTLVTRSGLTVQEVSAMLLAFELAGLIHPQTAGTYVRIR